VAGNDTGLSPRFVVVSETDPLERLQFTPDSVRTLRTTIIKPSNQSDAVDFTILWPIISTICHSIPLADYKVSD
jgi:hypothetical protein